MNSSYMRHGSLPHTIENSPFNPGLAATNSKECRLLFEFCKFLSKQVDSSKQVIKILSKEELQKK